MKPSLFVSVLLTTAFWSPLLSMAPVNSAPTSQKACQQSEEAVWRAFLMWFEAAPTVPMAVTLDAYRSKLSSEGVPSADIDSVLDVIRRRMSGPEGQRLGYNLTYRMADPVFTDQPNALVVEVAHGLRPGTALDVGMGQGRNSVYLAQQGWRVTGFDIADEGVKIANATAQRLGVTLDTVVATNETFDWGSDRWDLIVVTYALHTGPIERALKPGGTLVMETFLWDRTDKGLTRPADAIGPNQLLTAFPSLRILKYEDTVATPDWGNGTERKPTRIVRLVARKEPK